MSGTRAWVGTGWKMNKTIGEARQYARALAAATLPDDIEVFVLPAHTALAAVRDELLGCTVRVGAQNAHWAPEGAQTGEVSMRMARDAGASLVEFGHSERRASFGETDETVCLKTRAALDAGLTPVICVGESLAVRSAGDAETFVVAQVRRALADASGAEIPEVILAYEPVWAIGAAGRAATSAETAPVMAAIAAEVDRLSDGAGCLALLYGGSVRADNVAELLGDPHTDGVFVGRSAWTAEGLLEIVSIVDAIPVLGRETRATSPG